MDALDDKDEFTSPAEEFLLELTRQHEEFAMRRAAYEAQLRKSFRKSVAFAVSISGLYLLMIWWLRTYT